jgi:iron complex outermembrane receptor protein
MLNLEPISVKIQWLSLIAFSLLGAFLISTPQPVVAQGASVLLEEIVVTARRREESLVDLPMSVSAITAEGMQALGIHDIMDVTDHVPNVNFTHTGRRSITALYIRGIGNSSPIPLRASGSGVYVDGHYLPNTVGQMLNTLDIERVEIMRGPQGTLFGKNTTGGAINVISAKPGPEFDASITARVGEDGQRDIRGMVNLPISDTLSTRFGYAHEESDGFYFNRTLNEDRGATNLDAFTGALRFTPNENWTVDLSFRGNYQEDDNAPGRCTARPTQENVDNLANLNPGNPNAGRPEIAASDPSVWDPVAMTGVHPPQIYTGPVFPEDGRSQWGGAAKYPGPGAPRVNVGGHIERLYPGATIDYWNDCNEDNAAGDYVFSSEKDTFLELDNEQIGATVQYDSNGDFGALDNLNVKLVYSTHDMDYNYIQDRDFTSLDIDAIGTSPQAGPGRNRQTDSFEVLISADVNEQFSFVAGAHFYDDFVLNGSDCLEKAVANFAALSDPNGTFSIPCTADGGTGFDWLGSPRDNPGPGPVPSGRAGNVSAESKAIFAHVTWSINEDWTLDVGARYTDEDRGFHQTELESVGESCSFGLPGDPPTTELCQPTLILSYESMFAAGFYNDVEANFKEVTPMISLSRDFENSMVYASYSEGFLSGAFNDELNATLLPELAPLLTYGPEFVSNYEIGFKGKFADGKVSIAAAAFYMDYTDKQEQVTIDNSDGAFGGDPDIQIVTNAGAVDIKGVELELRAAAWENGFVTLDVGYLNSKYSKFDTFDINAPGGGAIIDQSQLTIADFSPEWTVSASIEHLFPLSNGATVTPQLRLYYQADYDFIGALDGSANEESFCHQDAYAKLSARVTYVPAASNWQASVFGSNITDKRYLEWCGNGRSGSYYSRFGQPATWGLEFKYDWGGS